jgi:dTDP-4-amino-4,6-dideoxygalactose transaminase
MQVPLSGPDITQRERDLINQVLGTPYLSMGPKIELFEQALAEYVGRPFAVGVSSGTAGLHLAVIAAGVEEGDLVITTPFSFVASANCILYQRAIPIFVDIDRQTMNLDPALVAQAVVDLTDHQEWASRWLPPHLRDDPSNLGKVKAILPVHIFGQPADMEFLTWIAERYHLPLIEDACEALGAEYQGKKAGSLGDVAVFAFYPNKQLTTGEGGMLVTDREEWAALFRSLRNQGRDDSGAWLNHVRLGYNYRLDELSAALGLAQMERFEELLSKRERVAGWYGERLQGLEGVETPFIAPQTTRVGWFVYVVSLASHVHREALMTSLEERGIPSRAYFPPIHLQPFYRQTFGFEEGAFPVAESVASCTLALPFCGTMTEEQVEYVCDKLGSSLRSERCLKASSAR